MIFLVDEDSAAGNIVAALKRLGHSVHLATNALARGSADIAVARYAEDLGAIIVTRNKPDFWRYLQPRSDTTPRAFVRAGALFMMCKHHISDRRLDQFDKVLRTEHERVSQSSADPRFLVEITEVRVIIHR